MPSSRNPLRPQGDPTDEAQAPRPGDPCWYDLYHEVREGGKSLLLLGVRTDLIKPLVREFGPDGFFIMPDREFDTETAGREFIKSMEVG